MCCVHIVSVNFTISFQSLSDVFITFPHHEKRREGLENRGLRLYFVPCSFRFFHSSAEDEFESWCGSVRTPRTLLPFLFLYFEIRLSATILAVYGTPQHRLSPSSLHISAPFLRLRSSIGLCSWVLADHWSRPSCCVVVLSLTYKPRIVSTNRGRWRKSGNTSQVTRSLYAGSLNSPIRQWRSGSYSVRVAAIWSSSLFP